MPGPSFSSLRSVSASLLHFARATAAATFRLGARGASYVRERIRLSSEWRRAERARLVLGEKLCEQGEGDEELRRRIAAETGPSRVQRRQRERLLRELADGALARPEPPPGIGGAYRDFRRAQVAVAESRRRVADARAALRPADWREGLHVGCGTVALASMLVVIVLVLAPSRHYPTASPPEVVGEATGDGEQPQVAAAPAVTPAVAEPPPTPAPPVVAAPPEDPADPTPTRGMTETLDLDLKTDPRKVCQVRGEVGWEAGRLTLAPDTGIARALDLGSAAELTLQLAFAPLAEDGQTSTTRFAFQTRNRGEFVVLLVRRRQGGGIVSELRFIDQDTLVRGQKVTTTLRTFDRPGDLPEGPWTFRHHHGLLTVYCGKRRMGVAYADKAPGSYRENPSRRPPANQRFYDLFGIDEPLEVSGWSLGQQGTPVACTAVSGKASPSYRTTAAPSFDQNAREIGRHVGTPGNRESSDLRARIDHPIWADPEFFPLLLRDWQYDYRRMMIGKCLGEDHPYFALALLGGALQHQWGFKVDVAGELLEKAVAVAEASLGAWHPDCILAVASLGRLYGETGKFDRAEALLRKALAATSEVYGPRDVRYAGALQDLARLLQNTNRLAEAETLLERAVEVCKDAPPRDRANAQVRLSEVEVRLGEREKAAALLEQAQQALAKLSDHAWENRPGVSHQERWGVFVDLAEAQARRGWGFLQRGQAAPARKLAREAFFHLVTFRYNVPGGPERFRGWDREMLRDVTPNNFMVSHPSYGRVMIRLADLFITLGDFHPACACVSLADKVSLDITARHDAAVLYRTTAKLYEVSPNVELGYWVGHMSERQRLDTSLKSLQARNDAEERERQEYIAWVQSPVSKDRQTPEEKQKRDATFKKLYRSRAVLPPGMRNNNPARKPDYALDWHKIAVREFERASGPDHPETVEALLNQARWEWRSRGAGDARDTLLDASGRAAAFSDRVLPGLPETQAYQYLEAMRPTLDLLLSCYRATNGDHARDAYEAVWRGKALATRQVMERRQLLRAAAGGPEVRRLVTQLQTTRQRLASVSLSPPDLTGDLRREQLAELIRRKEDLERELARRSERLNDAQNVVRGGVADMAGRLPARCAVVDFVERREWSPPSASGGWRRTRCYDAFVVRPAAGGPGWSAAWLALGDADALDRLLDEWVAGLRSARRTDRGLADQLRRRLWEPVEAALRDCDTVVLIPDGRLAQVPWPALPGRRADSYLVEDYALAQAPFGQYVARSLAGPAPEGDGLLLVGGIDYGPEGKWKALPGTAAEVRQLEELRAGPRTVRLGDEAATKARLMGLLPGSRYVHLATHGEFLDPAAEGGGRFQVIDRTSGGAVLDVTARNPLLLSMLVLSGANRPAAEADGFLTAEEVMGLDLARTELVVLSACETGLGKVRGGEGVFSLQRAFHASGSRSVVASLWQIPDRATQVLMRRFYENLWHRKMSKLEALREAQLWMLREAPRQPDLLRGGLQRIPDEEREPKDGRLSPYYWAAFVLSGDWR